MESGDRLYLWQSPAWPNWRYDLSALAGPLAEASRVQGLLLGRLADVGMPLRDQASLAALSEDELIALGVLRKTASGGRSTAYELNGDRPQG